MLAVLPEAVRLRLHDACISLDTGAIMAAIGETEETSASLSRTLTLLAESFEYSGILKALDALMKDGEAAGDGTQPQNHAA